MSKLYSFILLFFISFNICSQIDFKQLKESQPINFTKYMIIHEYTLEGQLYTGDAIQKNRSGDVTFHFEQGRKQGLVSTFFKNGKRKRETLYKNGETIYVKIWRKSGIQKSEILYKKGYRKSQQTWHSNGELNLSEKYRKNGDLRIQSIYYNSDNLKEKGKEIRIINGNQEKFQKTGKWKYYDKKGVLKKVEKWKKGELVNKRKK